MAARLGGMCRDRFGLALTLSTAPMLLGFDDGQESAESPFPDRAWTVRVTISGLGDGSKPGHRFRMMVLLLHPESVTHEPDARLAFHDIHSSLTNAATFRSVGSPCRGHGRPVRAA